MYSYIYAINAANNNGNHLKRLQISVEFVQGRKLFEQEIQKLLRK